MAPPERVFSAVSSMKQRGDGLYQGHSIVTPSGARGHHACPPVGCPAGLLEATWLLTAAWSPLVFVPTAFMLSEAAVLDETFAECVEESYLYTDAQPTTAGYPRS